MFNDLRLWLRYYLAVKRVPGVTWRQLIPYCWATRYVGPIKYHDPPQYLAEELRGYCDWPAHGEELPPMNTHAQRVERVRWFIMGGFTGIILMCLMLALVEAFL